MREVRKFIKKKLTVSVIFFITFVKIMGMKTNVSIWEMDRWSGKKLDETKEFDTEQEAIDFCKEYNKKNNKDVVPEWCMVANLSKYDY
jgi:hypothetical protein